MKKLPYLALVALVSGLLLQRCGNSPDKDSKETADSINEAKADSIPGDSVTASAQAPASEEDSKFAVDAADGGMAEVALSQLAAQKATDPTVKEFASMMVADHTKANEELKALAQKKNIVLPTSLSEGSQKDRDDLSKKNSKDFDKAYVKQMVRDHKKVIGLFEDAVQKVTDAELKAFAVKNPAHPESPPGPYRACRKKRKIIM